MLLFISKVSLTRTESDKIDRRFWNSFHRIAGEVGLSILLFSLLLLLLILLILLLLFNFFMFPLFFLF